MGWTDMKSPEPNCPASKHETGACLARSVADTLSEEPALEAVTIDRAHQKISLATLGRTDVPRLTERITSQLEAAQSTDPGHVCSLLNGTGDCFTCDTPLPESERKRITIRHEGDTTTIARVTCPTAPKFWRWRDIPCPRVVPRDVEFLESAEHIDQHINEWKAQLAAAVLCGVFGLGGLFLPAPVQGRLVLHRALISPGRCFTGGGSLGAVAGSATIDVHFLMLPVAAGAACNRRVGRRRDVVVSVFAFRRAGTLRAGPHAEGNSLALPRRAQDRHGGG